MLLPFVGFVCVASVCWFRVCCFRLLVSCVASVCWFCVLLPLVGFEKLPAPNLLEFINTHKQMESITAIMFSCVLSLAKNECQRDDAARSSG